jgi:steroid delta-isomerase-like uncharacterized protein
MRRRTLVAGGALIGAAAPLLARQAQAADATIARRFADALTAHNIEAFAALFSESYVNHQTSAAAPSPPAGVSPKAATVAFFAARLKALPDLKVSIQTTVAEGDKVAASFVYEGTHEGPYYGIDPTHKRLWFTSCDIFRIADGQIVEHWGMGDIAGIVAQIRG